MKTYATRDDAVAAEVTERLEEWIDVIDIDAIADEAIEETEAGWRAREMEGADFWKLFQKHCSVKTKILTFTVVKQFPGVDMTLASYGRETYMLPYHPGLKPGEGVDVVVEILD